MNKGIIKQIEENKSTYSPLTLENLSKIIEDAMRNDKRKFIGITGKGGAISLMKEYNKQFNVKNPEVLTFKQIITYFRLGWIKPIGGGLYEF